MALEQFFQDAMAQPGPAEETKPPCDKWTSFPDETDSPPSAGFDCNICLDSVHDPVVTLCGHLFCWPCIYKWLHFQSASQEPQQQQCPVCKAEVSQASLVPLYGRGQATRPSKGKAPSLGIVIPRRPPFCGIDSPRTPSATTPTVTGPQLYHRSYPYQPNSPSPRQGVYAPSPGRGIATNLLDPSRGIYGEMVYARVFGNSITNLYTYPNSYHLAGNASPRVRRHVMQADESLSRICFFLFCCLVLCLLLF